MTKTPQNSTQRTRRRVIGVAGATVAAAGIAMAVVWGGAAAGAPAPASRPAAFVSTEDNPHPEDRTTATTAVVPGDRHGGTGTEPGDDRDARTQATDGRGAQPAPTTYAPPTSTGHPESHRSHVEPGDDHGRHVEPGDDHGNHLEPGDDHGGRHNEPGDDHRGDSGHGGPGRH